MKISDQYTIIFRFLHTNKNFAKKHTHIRHLLMRQLATMVYFIMVIVRIQKEKSFYGEILTSCNYL